MDKQMDKQALLRQIPKIDSLIDGELDELLSQYPRRQVLDALRELLDVLRGELLRGDSKAEELTVAAIKDRLDGELERRSRPYYQRVINATGIILHTALGRASIAPEAVAALAALAGRPQRIEIELESGERGGRDRGCADLITQLTGAEAATVVNNNAAATLLILAALAREREVLVSRGELVEIGGSYRIPDIMRESGARLLEVGTTNRTHLRDYAEKLHRETGMILKVHTSNYRVIGFTAEVEVATLIEIGREHGVAVVYDLGSGCLADLVPEGLDGEALVRELIANGVDLVCFSGDKLLGGPQAGILAGRSELVESCRQHPLFRTMRPGRLVYTALEATLRLYLGGDQAAIERIPALRQLTLKSDDLRESAVRWATKMADLPGLQATALACASQAGSGSMPTQELPSWGIALASASHAVGTLARELRTGQPAILARVRDDAVVLDLRTLDEGELTEVFEQLRALCAPAAPSELPAG